MKTSKMTLANDGVSERHHVCGRAVHCGDQLQIELGGHWICVRYEAQIRGQIITPVLYAKGGRVTPEDDALFRWPES